MTASFAARAVKNVHAYKVTYRKLFNASLYLGDKCNLISSTKLKARVVALRGGGARRYWNSSAFQTPRVPVPRGGRSDPRQRGAKIPRVTTRRVGTVGTSFAFGSPAPCRRDLATNGV